MSPTKRRKLEDGSSIAAMTEASSNAAKDQYETENDASTKTGNGKDKDNSRSLFVRSLSSTITSESLAAHFSESYPLKHATVVVDPTTKISRGFGFVTFTDAEDAATAAAQFDNSTLDGRRIRVEVAQARHREGPGAVNGAPVVGEKSSKKNGAVNATGEKLRAEREQTRKAEQPPRLIVRNLPWSIKTADDLTKLFLSYGKVKHAVVPKKGGREIGEGYGFGIVIIRGKKNAEKALKGVNGKEVDGRVLAVDWAVDRDTWEKVKETAREDTEATPANGIETSPDADDEEAQADASSDAGVSLRSEDEAMEELLDEENLSIEDDDSFDSEPIDTKTKPRIDTSNTTVFVRNLPYDTNDEALREHFNRFGPTRYARVVFDHATERPKGTGFVCFVEEDDARTCVTNAPKKHNPLTASNNANTSKKRKGETLTRSILQDEASDPSGDYTLSGRVLQVTRALAKPDADARASESARGREKARERDTRRLFLLSEGTVPHGSKLFNQLSEAERNIRDASAKQRQKLIKTNPNLGLSLTRLSIRNVPRWIDSKALKALAREAVVGFAEDVKAGKRAALSAEEQRRGGEEMKELERRRKSRGVGIVKQAKVVFEGKEGGKVKEGAGGRSRGYGFIEYWSHRSALSGLRWLNGHVVGKEGERGKRLIAEFALDNAQVVQRRGQREEKARSKRDEGVVDGQGDRKDGRDQRGTKRKRVAEDVSKLTPPEKEAPVDEGEKNKIAKRNRIISKKRHARRARKG
jgi:nucleolar protein 4